MKLPTTLSRRARRFFLFVHLWLGLIIGLWFMMMGLTGRVLAWLPDLVAREMKATFPYQRNTPNTPQISLSRAVSAMRAAHPDVQEKELRYAITPNARYPFYFFFRDKPFEGAMYLIDPYSGKVNRPIRVEDLWTGKIAHLHAELLWEAKGVIANGIGSFLGVLLLLSGLWLWWPSTVGQLKARLKPKPNASFRRRLLDLHNMMGAYLYLLMFLVTFTGLLLALDRTTKKGVTKSIDRIAGVSAPKQSFRIAGETRLGDDELVRLAIAANPGMELQGVERPVKANEPFIAEFGQPGPGFLGDSDVKLDPYTGKVLQIERNADGSPGQKTTILARNLHFGLFGGIWSKTLYTIVGLLPLGLYITGLLMWWNKKRRKNAGPVPLIQQEASS